MDRILGDYLLHPHPVARPDAVGSVSCSVIWQGIGDWALDFHVSEPPVALSLPQAQPPARRDGLWETTCFELFLQRQGEAGYFEFNFSPSGQWAAYRFEDYRRGAGLPDLSPPFLQGSDREQLRLAMKARHEGAGLPPESVEHLMTFFSEQMAKIPEPAAVDLRALYDGKPFATGGPWRAGLSAVIEEANGTKSYWALAHPSDKPDFHHPDSFVLELP